MARVCVDSSYFEVNGSGQLTIVPGALGFQAFARFTTVGSSNFAIADYPGINWLFVEAVGGGGGGAGTTAGATFASAQGGGSGGSYAASWIDATTLPALVALTVGAGGAGGPGVIGTGASGASGGDSSFGAFVVAPGGIGTPVPPFGVGGAAFSTEPGASGPAVGTGMIRRGGDHGKRGIVMNSTVSMSGAGGSSGWPGRGGESVSGVTGTGQVGQTNGGGGGSGAVAFNNANAGGNGADGFVQITFYR